MRIIAIFGGHGVPPHPRRPLGRGNFSRPAFEGGGGGGGWRLSRRPRRPLEVHRDDRLILLTFAVDQGRFLEGRLGEAGAKSTGSAKPKALTGKRNWAQLYSRDDRLVEVTSAARRLREVVVGVDGGYRDDRDDRLKSIATTA